MKIGVGDIFIYNKNHWTIVDVRGESFVCKNKENGSVVNFLKEMVIDLFSKKNVRQ